MDPAEQAAFDQQYKGQEETDIYKELKMSAILLRGSLVIRKIAERLKRRLSPFGGCRKDRSDAFYVTAGV